MDLFNLSDFLPKKPTDVELKVMKEMFEASVDGEAYDMDRWGQYFKPAGMGQVTGDPNKPAAARTSAAAPIDDQIDDAPASNYCSSSCGSQQHQQKVLVVRKTFLP
jgi:hypothetical protein